MSTDTHVAADDDTRPGADPAPTPETRDPMSDELIKSLERQLREKDELLAKVRDSKHRAVTEVKKLNEGHKLAQDERQKLEARVRELETSLDEVTKDRDGLKTAGETAPTEWKTKHDELAAKLRDRDHRDEFTKALGAQLQDGVPIEDLWAKAGYTPGDALPTPEQITEWGAKARAAAAYLFKPEGNGSSGSPGGTTQGGTNGNGSQRQPLDQGIPAGRGERDAAAPKFRVKATLLRDPEWKQANQEAVATASREGRLEIIHD